MQLQFVKVCGRRGNISGTIKQVSEFETNSKFSGKTQHRAYVFSNRLIFLIYFSRRLLNLLKCWHVLWWMNKASHCAYCALIEQYLFIQGISASSMTGREISQVIVSAHRVDSSQRAAAVNIARGCYGNIIQ